MNMSKVLGTGTKVLNAIPLSVRQASPQILTGVGIAAVVGSGIMLIRATLKAEPVITEFEEDLKAIEALEEKDYYSTELAKKEGETKSSDTFTVYRTHGWTLIKLYAPAVTLGATGIVCILGGHKILQQRNVALVAAYKAIEESYSAYRRRVINTIGAEKEAAIWQDHQKDSIVNPETNRSKQVTVVGEHGLSPYARCYDEVNTTQFKRNRADLNLVNIRAVQNSANAILNGRGYLFLNEVYTMLGMTPTPAGQVVGWLRGARGAGDGYVDFGLDDEENVSAQNFLNNISDAVWLDFNVDGVIYKSI